MSVRVRTDKLQPEDGESEVTNSFQLVNIYFMLSYYPYEIGSLNFPTEEKLKVLIILENRD